MSLLRRSVKRIISKAVTNDYQTLNVIELNAQRLIRNYHLLQQQHPQQAIISVLKGNAYGHGLVPITKILNELPTGCVAVDGYFEAAQIRDITKHHIIVLGYIMPENVHLLDVKRCSFVVQDLAGLQAFAATGKQVHVHLEINTGMNRLGLPATELDECLRYLQVHPTLRLEGVMTHLADADNAKDQGWTVDQIKRFDAAVKTILQAGFKPSLFHVAQTAGSTRQPSKYANAIRLGIGLYGINPLQPSDPGYETLTNLQPVLRLKSTVIKTIKLELGDEVSYSGTFVAPKAMTIAVLPIGYYEGIPRALSNAGMVSVGSQAMPIVGRVYMNHTMVDIADTPVFVGSVLTVIDNQVANPNSINQISNTFGLFSYELLVKLDSSTRRIIV